MAGAPPLRSRPQPDWCTCQRRTTPTPKRRHLRRLPSAKRRNAPSWSGRALRRRTAPSCWSGAGWPARKRSFFCGGIFHRRPEGQAGRNRSRSSGARTGIGGSPERRERSCLRDCLLLHLGLNPTQLFLYRDRGLALTGARQRRGGGGKIRGRGKEARRFPHAPGRWAETDAGGVKGSGSGVSNGVSNIKSSG